MPNVFNSTARKVPALRAVEPVLKDHLIAYKNVVSHDSVFGDRFNFTEMYTFC